MNEAADLAGAFVIRKWDEIFENAQSRKVAKLLWIGIPNGHDSFGFRMLMSRANGTELYGAWILLVEVASRCDVRGVLVKNGVILTAPMIAMLTHSQTAIISEMLEVVQSKGIEWLGVNKASNSHAATIELVANTVSESTQPVFPPSFLPSYSSGIKDSSCSGNGFHADEAFEELWLKYPGKGRVKKVLSQQYYCEEIRNAAMHAHVMDAVTAKWEPSEKWHKGFVLALPEWIHNRCWDEEPESREVAQAVAMKSTGAARIIEQRDAALQEALARRRGQASGR